MTPRIRTVPLCVLLWTLFCAGVVAALSYALEAPGENLTGIVSVVVVATWFLVTLVLLVTAAVFAAQRGIGSR
jgi:hypothetical protein